MDRCIIFLVGSAAAAISEVFWRGHSDRSVALWGGAGMLLLRRMVVCFPYESRALLCVFGAVLLAALRLSLFILHALLGQKADRITMDPPSFSYGLYRFLLIAPAYTVIEYLETCFGM